MSSTRCPNTSRGWFFKDIPAEWDSIPLKYACVLTSEYGANMPADRYVSEGVRFLRTSDINDNGELASSSVFISEADAAEYLLAERDLLISRSGTVGRSFLYSKSHGPCAYAGYLIRYRLKQSFAPKYIFYLTKSAGFQKWIGTVAIEATIGNVNGEKYANFSFPSPSFQTQLLIANYLDRETARIDRLIAEKERMLALLDEKRSALISRVVTRGLNPDAPLKDSRQEWLGMIPAHWKVIRIKHVTASLDQGSSPVAANTPAAPGELGILKLSAVSKGRFKREENKALREKEEEEQLLALVKDDILITRGNTPDLVADAAVVPEDEPNLLLPDLIYRLRVEDRVMAPEYLASFLITPAARVQIRRDARGSSGSMVKVSQSHVLDWVTPLPPLAEQLEIINYLREKESHQELLSREVSSSLELLIERRAALITAAVTGQIPVEEMSQ